MLSGFTPKSLVVDEHELERFVEWLPGIGETEAYRVMLMIRSRGLKEKYGFKGSDHVLVHKAVHGYLSEIIPESYRFAGRKYWRLRLFNEVRRLGVLAVQAEWEYVRHREGTEEIEEIITVPWQLLAIYVQVNPCRILDAARDTVNDVVAGFVEMAKSGKVRNVYRRPDLRYYANLARRTHTIFHSVDVDTHELTKWLEDELLEVFGYLPARITTQRGAHYLVNLPKLMAEDKIKRWVHGKIPPCIKKAIGDYKSKKCTPEKCPNEYNVITSYVDDRTQPLYHRIEALSVIARAENGAPLIEISKQALEPAPGTIYKGQVIVRFTPEEK